MKENVIGNFGNNILYKTTLPDYTRHYMERIQNRKNLKRKKYMKL